MQITLSTFGTVGDLLPFLALGRALQARGHKIVMAIPGKLLAYAQRARLDAMPCHPHFGQSDYQAFAAGFDQWPAGPIVPLSGDEEQITAKAEAEQRRWCDDFDLETRIHDLVAACRNADLLICHSLIGGEPVAAEIAGIRCVQAHIAPERLWHHRFQNFLAELEQESVPMSSVARIHFENLQHQRLRCGLPARPPSGWRGYFRSFPTLLGASPRFLAPLEFSDWKAEICGFWFYDDPTDCPWESDPELTEFVARGPAPIVLSFSSLPLTDPDRVLAMHIEAARQISRPLVVLAGWSGMKDSARFAPASDVLMRNFLPGDWLLARAAAVIHHGGIGSTARALRNACPMLVEPRGNDQFFNAMMVLKNAVGTAANPKNLTAGEIARLLATKVLSRETKDRATALAGEIRREDGIGEAVQLIENLPQAAL